MFKCIDMYRLYKPIKCVLWIHPTYCKTWSRAIAKVFQRSNSKKTFYDFSQRFAWFLLCCLLFHCFYNYETWVQFFHTNFELSWIKLWNSETVHSELRCTEIFCAPHSTRVIYYLGTFTVPSFATFKQMGQKVLSRHLLLYRPTTHRCKNS